MEIWYLFPILVRCTKKNLATLSATANSNRSEVSFRRKEKGVAQNQGDRIRLRKSRPKMSPKSTFW
jgi:hypothetical protein